MKSDLAPSIVEQSIINNIVEVKETVAKGIRLANTSPRSFGLIDLWNIRRNARLASATVRRY